MSYNLLIIILFVICAVPGALIIVDIFEVKGFKIKSKVIKVLLHIVFFVFAGLVWIMGEGAEI